MINILGFFANLTSLILWIPQAIKTWNIRKDIEELNGISIGTQIFAATNSLLWGLYGFANHDLWLAFGTTVVVPLTVFTIIIKISASSKSRKKRKIKS